MRILCLLLLALGAHAQPVRIDVYLHATNAVDLVSLKASVDSGLGLLPRTNDVRAFSLVRTNGLSGVDYHAIFFVRDAEAAESAFNAATNLVRPAQSSGRIIIHRCPADGDPLFRNWPGCDSPAAQLRRFQWP